MPEKRFGQMTRRQSRGTTPTAISKLNGPTIWVLVSDG
jgi:hypothetical protein